MLVIFDYNYCRSHKLLANEIEYGVVQNKSCL